MDIIWKNILQADAVITSLSQRAGYYSCTKWSQKINLRIKTWFEQGQSVATIYLCFWLSFLTLFEDFVGFKTFTSRF